MMDMKNVDMLMKMGLMSAESSSVIFQQVLVPFLLAGLGTVTAGIVLDIIQVSFDIEYVLTYAQCCC